MCDTSLVAVLERASAEPTRLAHWSEDMRARLDRAVLAISVVAEAEMRAGWAYANWGRRRVAAAELRLRAYLTIPLDRDTLEAWSQLSAESKQTAGTCRTTTSGSPPPRCRGVCRSLRATAINAESWRRDSR